MKIFTTGVLGFIGSHFAEIALAEGHEVVGFSRNSDQKNFHRIARYRENPRFKLVLGDLAEDISGIAEDMDVIVNFAAKTFVDHSIVDPAPFLRSNIFGTYNLLEQARKYKTPLFVQVSTDEVYGAILEGEYREDARINPTNPYAATKAGADALAIAYFHTYKLPVIITRTENNYGPFQHPQKAMPVFVRNALQDKSLPVYGDGRHRRMWLHVEDHCRAILHLIEKGTPGEIYHVAGHQELENIELAKIVLDILGKPHDLITFVPDFNIRPGHDRRYALDVSKLQATDWAPRWNLEDGLRKTVEWYRDNQWWFM